MINRIVSSLGAIWGGRAPAPSIPLAETGAKFQPRSTADLPPLFAMLRKNGDPFPAIAEGADISHARGVLEGSLRGEMERFLESPPFEAVPWIAVVRNLDGTAEGLALSWLIGRGENTSMRCDRVVKRIFEGQGQVKGVGILLLMTQLRWMRGQGYWASGRELLRNYDPFVMAGYRRVCGLPKDYTDVYPIDTASVSRGEGEQFLSQCPIPIRLIIPA